MINQFESKPPRVPLQDHTTGYTVGSGAAAWKLGGTVSPGHRDEHSDAQQL